MGKRDHIKRIFKDFSKKPSASISAPTSSGTALAPCANGPTGRVDRAPLTDNQSQDASVRDLWSLALEKLSLEDKEAVSRIASGSKLDILQHLHAAAVKRRTDCEDQRWKFELNGRQIILRDVAEKIIVWIDKFKQIGDIAVNFDPVHASLPWAGIRFFLEMTVAESQQMGALLTGVEKLTPLLGRCQIYEDLYLKNEQFDQQGRKSAVENLMSALVTLYATMLNFLASAIRAYNKGIISRTLCAILNAAEVVTFIDKCHHLENNVAIEAENCERIRTRRLQASSEEQIQKLKQILADFQTPILRIDSRVAALCETVDSSKRLDILDWISSIQYKENHFFACQERTIGTGEWLLRHERYREWRASSASMILWLHGDPGAGKTKLVSIVIDDLLRIFEQIPNDEAFAYFYCDRNQSDRRDPALILSSFVRQLSTSRNDNEVQRSIIEIYNHKRQAASGKLKLEESQTVLADLFHVYPQITLVVDALDECDQKARLRFIDVLDKLIAESSKPVKILISSRRDNDIKQRLEYGPNLEIRASDNRDDIAMFVNHEITASQNFWQVKISSELKELICNTLVEKSDGMFQWVALQIAALREPCRERDIRNRLGKLPKTLKTAYDELYLKIQSQEESTPVIANRAFQWIMCSCWPLSPAELVAAVCQDPDTDETDEVDIDINVVLGACQNLLVVDQELNVCRFSHLSVQEYFEAHHWSSCEANVLVGKVCLSLLIDKLTGPRRPIIEKARDNSAHDVLEYACYNWVTHVQRLEENGIVENRLTTLLKNFLGSMDQSSLAYRNWHEWLGERESFGSDHFESFTNSPLYRAYSLLSPRSQACFAVAIFGFHKTLFDWWTGDFADIDQKNSLGDSLLSLGALRGQVSITAYLLEKGADVNHLGGEYGSALQAASVSGHTSIVQQLLDKGAEINTTGGKYGSALHAASHFGHESVVQLLLDGRADVNARGSKYCSVLRAASYFGYESVVRMLLDRGADVNATGGGYGSALQAASYFGHESVVRMLLDRGADVNATGGRDGSALQAASFRCHESVVQMLLDEGADVNATGGYYGQRSR